MDPLRPADSGRTSYKRSRKDRVSDSHPGGFAERLHETTNEQSEAEVPEPLEPPTSTEISREIESLLDDLHGKGQDLLNKRTYTAAQEYRAAIQAFLRRVVPEAVLLETHESSHSILSRKRYTLLGEINQKVDRLIGGILQSQLEQMEILSRLQEIEGLIVDLMH